MPMFVPFRLGHDFFKYAINSIFLTLSIDKMLSENLGYVSLSKLWTIRIIVYWQMTLTYEDVSNLIMHQNKLNFITCQELIRELPKCMGKVQCPSFLRANDIHLPKFSGDLDGDVKQFLSSGSNGNLVQIYKCPKGWSSSALVHWQSKCLVLSIAAFGGQNLWSTMWSTVVKQFLSKSDIWLLRQQLLTRKQTENESVAQFASEIRKLCLHLDLLVKGSVHFFYKRSKT